MAPAFYRAGTRLAVQIMDRWTTLGLGTHAVHHPTDTDKVLSSRTSESRCLNIGQVECEGDPPALGGSGMDEGRRVAETQSAGADPSAHRPPPTDVGHIRAVSFGGPTSTVLYCARAVPVGVGEPSDRVESS